MASAPALPHTPDEPPASRGGGLGHRVFQHLKNLLVQASAMLLRSLLELLVDVIGNVPDRDCGHGTCEERSPVRLFAARTTVHAKRFHSVQWEPIPMRPIAQCDAAAAVRLEDGPPEKAPVPSPAHAVPRKRGADEGPDQTAPQLEVGESEHAFNLVPHRRRKIALDTNRINRIHWRPLHSSVVCAFSATEPSATQWTRRSYPQSSPMPTRGSPAWMTSTEENLPAKWTSASYFRVS